MKNKLKEEMLKAIFIQTGGRPSIEKIADVCAEIAVKAISSNTILAVSLLKIKEQFEARKTYHLESAQHQPEKIDSKWSAENTAHLVDVLYVTVAEILSNDLKQARELKEHLSLAVTPNEVQTESGRNFGQSRKFNK